MKTLFLLLTSSLLYSCNAGPGLRVSPDGTTTAWLGGDSMRKVSHEKREITLPNGASLRMETRDSDEVEAPKAFGNFKLLGNGIDATQNVLKPLTNLAQ